MSHLSVVFWNHDEPTTKAATTLYVSEKELKPENLSRENGMTIPNFFMSRDITIEQYMEMFPGYVAPIMPTEDPLSWCSSLRWQSLPIDEVNMQRLATLVNMPISVFVYFRNRDEMPRLLYRVG